MKLSNHTLALVILVMAGVAGGCNKNGSPASTAGSPLTPSAVTAPAPTTAPTGPGAVLGPTQAVFVQSGDVWRYLDNGTDQGAAWSQRGFNDAAWATGGAELGYGDNDEITVVGFGPDGNNKFITTYFRRSFTVNDIAAQRVITLDMIRDDGAVVYVNGLEVFRTNMPGGPITSRTLASADIDNPKIVVSTDIDKNVLVNGNNVIAVEVHQASSSSADLSFNLALRDGSLSPQPRF